MKGEDSALPSVLRGGGHPDGHPFVEGVNCNQPHSRSRGISSHTAPGQNREFMCTIAQKVAKVVPDTPPNIRNNSYKYSMLRNTQLT
jgi:hypothetical protein